MSETGIEYLESNELPPECLMRLASILGLEVTSADEMQLIIDDDHCDGLASSIAKRREIAFILDLAINDDIADHAVIARIGSGFLASFDLWQEVSCTGFSFHRETDLGRLIEQKQAAFLDQLLSTALDRTGSLSGDVAVNKIREVVRRSPKLRAAHDASRLAYLAHSVALPEEQLEKGSLWRHPGGLFYTVLGEVNVGSINPDRQHSVIFQGSDEYAQSVPLELWLRSMTPVNDMGEPMTVRAAHRASAL